MSRTRGTGSIFQPTFVTRHGQRQTAKTWALAYYDRRAGRAVKEYGFPTQAAAEAALRQRLTDQDRGKPTGPAIERTTFADLAAMIVADYTANRRDTLVRVKECIVHLKRHFGQDKAKDIDEDRVRAYQVERLGEGAAPATVNRELSALKRMFRLGERKVPRVPRFAMLKERNVRQGFFEEQEFRAVLKHLSQDLQPIVETAYLTGWRVPSEILTRQWRHVDLKAGWLRLEPEEAKSEKGRMFPLRDSQGKPTRLHAVLSAQRRRTDALERSKGKLVPWIFHRSGRPIVVWRKDWTAACAAAGVAGRLVHDFRRTAARNFLRAGVPMPTIMALCGWVTPSMFLRYAVLDEAMLRSAVTGRVPGRDRARKAATAHK